MQHRDAVNAAIEARTGQYDSAECIDMLNAAGVPCGPIYTVDQVFADPQVQHLGMAKPVHHPRLGDLEVVAQPVGLSRAGEMDYRPTPDCGQHTDEVLEQFGFDRDEIGALRDAGVV